MSTDDDELLMMTARGKIQRIKASDVSVIGRNTQGVRIMGLDDGDTLTAIVRVPKDESEEDVAVRDDRIVGFLRQPGHLVEKTRGVRGQRNQVAHYLSGCCPTSRVGGPNTRFVRSKAKMR